MPRRVLWLTKGLGPGGTERLLVEQASARDPSRVELAAAYVLPYKDHLSGALEAAGVRVTCLSRCRRDFGWPVRLRRELGSGRFDIVHFHSPAPAAVGRLVAMTLPAAHRPV